MQKFFQDVGFQIADNWTGAVLIAGALVAVGLVLVVSGLRDHIAFAEYRVLAVILGCVLAIASVAALPVLKAEAEDACETWAKSPAPADGLRYADHNCDRLF